MTKVREFGMELHDWKITVAPPEKPKGRYMADVRHPLKPRRLDEPKWKFASPRMLHTPQREIPKEAPCSKCGKPVNLSEWWVHECFGPHHGACK